jgi:SNF2 family DNA or RNA helicase
MTVKLTIRKERVVLESPWRPSLPEDCKSVPGWSFSKTTKTWSWPLSLRNLRALRAVFGDELRPSEDLLAWARLAAATEKRLRGYQRVHDAKLMRVPAIAPQLAQAMKARTYQRSAARFVAVAGNTLLADEPGLGKTATSLAALMEAGIWKGDHLVVAPKSSLSSVWARQVEMWTGAPAVAMPEGRVAREKAWEIFQDLQSDVRFLIVNPTMLRRRYGHFCVKCNEWDENVKAKKKYTYIDKRTRERKTRTAKWPTEHHTQNHKLKRDVLDEDWPEIIEWPWASVIVDEAHDLFSAYRPGNISQATQGILDTNPDALRLALTGTPLRGHELKIWGSLNFLAPSEFSAYWAFVDMFFEVREGYFGKEPLGIDPGMLEEFGKVIDRRVMRRTRMEVRGDLPQNQRYDVMVEMSNAHRKQYDEFERDGETSLLSGTISGQGLLSELTRLKQMAYGTWTISNGKMHPKGDSPKLDWLVEWLRVRGVTGKAKTDWLPEKGSAYKHVIVSQSTEVLSAVERGLNDLGIKTLKIQGSVSGRNRAEAQAKFQSEDTEFRVMLIQTQTGGVAIELDAWCDEGVILDETWVADDQKQVEGRWDNRSGRVAPRSFYYVRTADTIDQKIAESNYSQQNLQHNLLDKRRGVEVALHLLKGN